MFWDACDSQERFILAYLAGSLLLTVAGSLSRRREEALVERLREELSHG